MLTDHAKSDDPEVAYGSHPIRVPVVISERHVHLTAPVFVRLFGEQHRPHSAGEGGAGQSGEQERLTLIGPNGRRLRDVRVLRQTRAINQIEITRTDAKILGIRAPVRDSGDLRGTPGVMLEGPRSRVALGTGVICTHRHVRMPPDVARGLGLNEHDLIEVSTEGCNRGLVFRDVVVRIASAFSLGFHLDTDEANAAALGDGDVALLHRSSVQSVCG